MIKLFGKKIHIITAFRDYWIVPEPETTYKVFSDAVEIDDRQTSEPRLYLLRLGKQTKEFLAKLEAYSTITLFAKRVRVAKKFYEKNYEIELDENNIAKEVKFKNYRKVSYMKYDFLDCQVVR